MGLIEGLFALVFGKGRNVVRETAGIFAENAEAGAQRGLAMQTKAMEQFGAEFMTPERGPFDRFMDGLNRLPRPALALGTLGLFVAAMIDPLWFAARMQGVALVPEPLWWLLGVIVSFYFGARHQQKAQTFQRDIARTMGRVPQVIDTLSRLEGLRHDSPGVADARTDAELTLATGKSEENAALDHWKTRRRG